MQLFCYLSSKHGNTYYNCAHSVLGNWLLHLPGEEPSNPPLRLEYARHGTHSPNSLIVTHTHNLPCSTVHILSLCATLFVWCLSQQLTMHSTTYHHATLILCTHSHSPFAFSLSLTQHTTTPRLCWSANPSSMCCTSTCFISGEPLVCIIYIHAHQPSRIHSH